MSWIRRTWTHHAADEWTKEDWFVIIISPLTYVTLTIGLALSLLLIIPGFILLIIGILLTLLMIYIINPKLSTISTEYEKKQKEYLEYLEKTERWEEES